MCHNLRGSSLMLLFEQNQDFYFFCKTGSELSHYLHDSKPGLFPFNLWRLKTTEMSWVTVEVYLCFLQYEDCVLHRKWLVCRRKRIKKKTTSVQNMNTLKPRFSHQFQRTDTPCREWEVMALELITESCTLRDKNLPPELRNTINAFHIH